MLAAELCNMGLFEQHALLVRKAVQLALWRAGALSARHLASLAQACGVLGNVPKPQMLVCTRPPSRLPVLHLVHAGNKMQLLWILWGQPHPPQVSQARNILEIILQITTDPHASGCPPGMTGKQCCHVHLSNKNSMRVVNVGRVCLQELAGHVERAAHNLRPRALVIVLQAFAHYRLSVPDLATALADTAERQLHTLTPMRLSMALFAFAKLSLTPRPSFAQCVIRETERRLDSFDARVSTSSLNLCATFSA